MRLVCDTNVLVAGLVAEGLCREIIETHLSEHTPILSEFLWHELVEKLEEKFGLSLGDLPVLSLYRRHATWVDVDPLAESVCRDRDDDWVLATAKAGDANRIVTGDADLLVLDHWEGIGIVNPRTFIERVRG